MNATFRTKQAIKGSGNIFVDLGFGREDAANLMARSTLMLEISRRITALKAPQRKVATMVGISQPRLNDLLRNKIAKFSSDALINILATLGGSISVVEKRRVRTPRTRATAHAINARQTYQVWESTGGTQQIYTRPGRGLETSRRVSRFPSESAGSIPAIWISSPSTRAATEDNLNQIGAR